MKVAVSIDVDGSGVAIKDKLIAGVNGLSGEGTPDERKALVLNNLSFCRDPDEEKKVTSPTHIKTNEQMRRLTRLLRDVPLFSEIEEKDVEAVLLAMKSRISTFTHPNEVGILDPWMGMGGHRFGYGGFRFCLLFFDFDPLFPFQEHNKILELY